MDHRFYAAAGRLGRLLFYHQSCYITFAIKSIGGITVDEEMFGQTIDGITVDEETFGQTIGGITVDEETFGQTIGGITVDEEIQENKRNCLRYCFTAN